MTGTAPHAPPPEARRAGNSPFGGLFAAAAARHAERTALIGDDRRVTYRELDLRANRLAHAMRARGIGRGDRVALLARNCVAYIEVEIAAAKIGAISVNLNWRSAPEELAHCLALTGPGLVIAAPEYGPGLADAGFPVDLAIGDPLEAAIADAPGDRPEAAVDVEDGQVIIFTSGTTGLPKGALISHRAMIARALVYASELKVPDRDTFVAWSPLFHIGANDFALATLLLGGQVVVVDGYRPDDIIRAIESFRVHYLMVLPGMIDDFLERLRGAGARFKPVSMIGAMADLVPRRTLSEATTFLNAPFVNTFGSTETGLPPATANFVGIGEEPERLSKRISAFCEVRLVDADDNDVADGEPGELAIRGPTVFSGYWANDEANRQAFRNGWFHMGDVFRRNPDGTVDFVDRVKYLIKSGGENIYPAEIEQHVLADPRIAAAAVVRRPDDRWGEVPVVFAARRDEPLTADDVVDMCRGRIASYKLPREVRFIAFDDIPRSTSGKIQRHLLEERLAGG